MDKLLSELGVPLIANCRGFSDEHLQEHNIIEKVISDSKKTKSIIALGIYYPTVALPRLDFLKSYNEAGFYAWLNGNLDGVDECLSQFRYIAMSDYIERCTHF